MEYGLWNIGGGFWPAGNSGSAPPEGILRNIYNPVNDIEPTAFQPSAGGDGVGVFTTGTGSLPCQPNMRQQTDFITMKDSPTVASRVSVSMAGHHDDHSQTVPHQIIAMGTDMMTEQSSMESLTSTESPLPPLMESPHNHTSSDGSPLTQCKKEKLKMADTSNEEEWGDANGNGTNVNVIKSENNPGSEYLFQQSYPQQPMYGMVFPRTAGSRREAGTSDETDEDDDETEETSAVQQSRPVDDLGEQDITFRSRSPSEPSSQEATPISFQRNGYECGECGLVAETRPSLKKHISLSHPAPDPDPRLTSALLKKITTTAKCPMTSCRFRTSDRNEMESHVARHVAGGYKMSSKKRSNSMAPQRVRYEREEYRCQICAYSCTVEKAYYKHLKVHTVGRQVNQVKISCVICGKDRSSEVDMNKHMKKHRDDRFFCCDICIFKTVQLKKLIQHRRMHTGEKPHLCPHCSYRSARRDNLRSHVRRVHKKDNLFCDTFSPRGLLLTANANTSSQPETSPTSSTPVPASSNLDSQ